MSSSISDSQIASLLKKAKSTQQSGKLCEALALYQQLLKIVPNNFDTLIEMGSINNQMGQFQDAVTFFTRASAAKSNSFSVFFGLGLALQGLKRYNDALANYDQALVITPEDADVYKNRCFVLNVLTRYDDAYTSCNRAIALKADFTEAYCNLGNVLGNLGRYGDAIINYEHALILEPDHAEACYKRGLALQRLQRYEDSLISYNYTITLQPNNAEAHHNRGVILQHLQRYEDALTSYNHAIALNPDNAMSYHNRGVILQHLKYYEDALTNYDRAISLKFENSETYNNRGLVLYQLTQLVDSLKSYDQAISLNPNYAEAFNNRGLTLRRLRIYDESLSSFDRAISLMPNYANAYYNKGTTLHILKRYEDALYNLDEAISINPNIPYVYGDRMLSRMYIGQWDNFDSNIKEIVERADYNILPSTPFPMLAIPMTLEILQKFASRYVTENFLPAHKTLWNGERYIHDRIRIGYFSADFNNHPTAYLIAELIEKHDRSRFEIYGFSYSVDSQDEMRIRLTKSFDHFLDVSQHSDHAIAALAHKMEIDIAVDLMGFTQNFHTGIFSIRPAPIQVNYLGFPGTMGAPFIDYIIGDSVVIPKDHFEYYTEKIVHLPYSYQVNDTKRWIADSEMTRSALGLPESGFVFCCFNSTFKITPDVFAIWMRLLSKVPDSVLWLFEDNTAIQNNLRREAQQRNVYPERLIFAPPLRMNEHLARHRYADLFLDTFYYNAHTTASDALWSDLPVLTCLGNTFAGRVAASLLYAVGLPELVTKDHDEYEAMALKLATNPGALATIKRKLAHNRSNFPLFNIDLFTRHIEDAYHAMWQRHQNGLSPDNIFIAPE